MPSRYIYVTKPGRSFARQFLALSWSVDPEVTGAKGTAAAAAAVSAFRPVTSFPYTFQTSVQIGLVCIHVPKGPCGSVTPT